MKETIEFIKKLWENKRTRSLVILIIYLIFFLFVFAIISPTKNTDKFYYLNNIDIVSYNAYDNMNNLILDYDKQLVSGGVIYKLVKNSTLESTNYIDNSNTYCISVKDYEKIINNSIVDNDDKIRITVSSTSIILDFTSYYGYKINIDLRS